MLDGSQRARARWRKPRLLSTDAISAAQLSTSCVPSTNARFWLLFPPAENEKREKRKRHETPDVDAWITADTVIYLSLAIAARNYDFQSRFVTCYRRVPVFGRRSSKTTVYIHRSPGVASLVVASFCETRESLHARLETREGEYSALPSVAWNVTRRAEKQKTTDRASNCLGIRARVFQHLCFSLLLVL